MPNITAIRKMRADEMVDNILIPLCAISYITKYASSEEKEGLIQMLEDAANELKGVAAICQS